jgi:hypothetical protein
MECAEMTGVTELREVPTMKEGMEVTMRIDEKWDSDRNAYRHIR